MGTTEGGTLHTGRTLLEGDGGYEIITNVQDRSGSEHTKCRSEKNPPPPKPPPSKNDGPQTLAGTIKNLTVLNRD